MVHPTLWEKRCQLYALGNTPAVDLLQDLTPEDDLDVLLLACGDPRSLLFTVFNRTWTDESKVLDVTCCDLEPAVLARNILLFTLIVDGHPLQKTWEIFYHFKISKDALSLLASQCTKLLSISASLSTWSTSSPYSPFLKFCSSYTLVQLRRFWQLYADHASGKASSPTPDIKPPPMISRFHHVNNIVARSTGDFTVYAAEALGKNFLHYWKHGIVDEDDPRLIARATHVNPTFCFGRYGPLGDHTELNYGVYPLSGFLLSEVFVRGGATMKKRTIGAFVECARRQFGEWGRAFKDAVSGSGSRSSVSSGAAGSSGPRVIVRFFVGDAIRFCRTLLRCEETSGKELSAGLTNCAFNNVELVLDRAQYGGASQTRRAPTTFNVIDTSNVVDHVGFLNIILCTVPLLSRSSASASSTLYTESFCEPIGKTFSSLLEHLCVSEIPLFAILFGIVPAGYVAGFTPHIIVDEVFSARVKKPLESYHERIPWKLVETNLAALIPASTTRGESRGGSTIQVLQPYFEPGELARLVLGMMRNMMPNEHIGVLFSQLPTTYSNTIHYTRSTLASLISFFLTHRLRLHQEAQPTTPSNPSEPGIALSTPGPHTVASLISTSEASYKGEFTTKLLELIREDKILIHNSHSMSHYQDLCLQLHLHSIGSTSVIPMQELKTLSIVQPIDTSSSTPGPLRGWKGEVPDMLWVVLVIPREGLKVLDGGDPERVGNPMMQVAFWDGNKEKTATPNVFTGIECTWGEAVVAFPEHPEKTRVSIVSPEPEPSLASDSKLWNSTSSLVVHFPIPASVFRKEYIKEGGMMVGLWLCRTVGMWQCFGERLGKDFEVWRARACDRERVLVVGERPGFAQAEVNVEDVARAPASAVATSTSGDRSSSSELTTPFCEPLRATIELTPSGSNNSELSVACMRCHIALTTDAEKSALAGGAEVRSSQVGFCVLKVEIGSVERMLGFPFPFEHGKTRVRIARKSGWVEVITHISRFASSEQDTSDLSLYRLSPLVGSSLSPSSSSRGPLTWNIHRIDLSKLPIFTRRPAYTQWINFSVGSAFSMVDLEFVPAQAGEPEMMRVKDTATVLSKIQHTIHAFFVLSMQNPKCRVFYINLKPNNLNAGGPVCRMVVFLNELRIDLGNYGDFVMDCWVLPLTEEIERAVGGRGVVQGFARAGGEEREGFDVEEDEMRGWMSLMPSFVERCRVGWGHDGGRCECVVGLGGGEPSSSDVASSSKNIGGERDGEAGWKDRDPICSCGRGMNIAGFEKKHLTGGSLKSATKKKIASYVTRAAISQLYTVPYIESVFNAVKKDVSTTTVPGAGPPESAAFPSGTTTRTTIPGPLPAGLAGLGGSSSATAGANVNAASRLPSAGEAQEVGTGAENLRAPRFMRYLEKKCEKCGKAAAGPETGDGAAAVNGGLLRCSRCRTVFYCGEECQRKDWKDHRKYCDALKAKLDELVGGSGVTKH